MAEAIRDVAKLMAVTTLEAKPELTALFKQGARPAAVEVKTDAAFSTAKCFIRKAIRIAQ